MCVPHDGDDTVLLIPHEIPQYLHVHPPDRAGKCGSTRHFDPDDGHPSGPLTPSIVICPAFAAPSDDIKDDMAHDPWSCEPVVDVDRDNPPRPRHFDDPPMDPGTDTPCAPPPPDVMCCRRGTKSVHAAGTPATRPTPDLHCRPRGYLHCRPRGCDKDPTAPHAPPPMTPSLATHTSTPPAAPHSTDPPITPPSLQAPPPPPPYHTSTPASDHHYLPRGYEIHKAPSLLASQGHTNRLIPNPVPTIMVTHMLPLTNMDTALPPSPTCTALFRPILLPRSQLPHMDMWPLLLSVVVSVVTPPTSMTSVLITAVRSSIPPTTCIPTYLRSIFPTVAILVTSWLQAAFPAPCMTFFSGPPTGHHWPNNPSSPGRLLPPSFATFIIHK
jgi:hypothetical protein